MCHDAHTVCGHSEDLRTICRSSEHCVSTPADISRSQYSADLVKMPQRYPAQWAQKYEHVLTSLQRHYENIYDRVFKMYSCDITRYYSEPGDWKIWPKDIHKGNFVLFISRRVKVDVIEVCWALIKYWAVGTYVNLEMSWLD